MGACVSRSPSQSEFDPYYYIDPVDPVEVDEVMKQVWTELLLEKEEERKHALRMKDAERRIKALGQMSTV